MKTTIRKFVSNRYKANAACPCGKDNKNARFATEKGYEGQPVGHCHDCVKDFWPDDTTLVNLSGVDRQTREFNYCSFGWKDIEENFDFSLESGFAKFLLQTVGEKTAKAVVEKYLLGVWEGDVIFWQIDQNFRVRHGEIIKYNSEGKRRKMNSYRHVKNIDCQLEQCLFGEHLGVENDLPYAIVESAKTAVIMSIILPCFNWSATNSAGQLEKKCKALVGKKVTLFPDHNQYDKNSNWKATGDKYGFKVSRDCELWYEAGLIAAKDDIADYYLNGLKTLDEPVKIVDPEWNNWLAENQHLVGPMGLSRN